MRLLRADLGRVTAWGGTRGVERGLAPAGETWTAGFEPDVECCRGVVGFAVGVEDFAVDSRRGVLERDDLVVFAVLELSF